MLAIPVDTFRKGNYWLMEDSVVENPYLLLTPGPLSTTRSVKDVMLRDWCTWDKDYNAIVQKIRGELLRLAEVDDNEYTTVLMQGSGTFSVESVITTALPHDGKVLVAANGAYGQRIAKIAQQAGIDTTICDFGETSPVDIKTIDEQLRTDHRITHIAVVHCETTTGMLNDIKAIGELTRIQNKIYIVDAMSSFGGIPIPVDTINADFLISSANKCIQGVPGFGFIIARRSAIAQLEGQARSLSLDLYDQWRVMEEQSGKWRFTSPTHVVRAFARALTELTAEGGVSARYDRYRENHRILVEGMILLGFKPLLENALQSPIITAFYNPAHPDYRFEKFYNELKEKGFVIYPGKVTDKDTFRIGNIGDIRPEDMTMLIEAIAQSMYWKR